MTRHVRLVAVLSAALMALAACGGGSSVGGDLADKDLKGKGGALDLEEQLEKAGDTQGGGALGAEEAEDPDAERQKQLEAAEAERKAAQEKQAEQVEQVRAERAVSTTITAQGIKPNVLKVVTGGVVEVCNQDTTSDEDDAYAKERGEDYIPGRRVVADDPPPDRPGIIYREVKGSPDTDSGRPANDPSDQLYGFISPSIAHGKCWSWNAVDPHPSRRGQPATPGYYRFKDFERKQFLAFICVLPPNGQDSHCG